jgi:hypothetical protein
MAIQPARLLLASTPDWGVANAAITVNAAGESVGIVGNVRIAGNASSKTISAAGSGRILWLTGTVTFATSGSTVRVGIQDVSLSNGLEDGTYDVYKEYVQGTDTISVGYNIATMGSGSKTLSDGDVIAIVVEMPVRNGVDSITVGVTAPGITAANANQGFPYGTSDTAALAKQVNSVLYAVISFDDGTAGWIQGASPLRDVTTGVSINSGSTPDEYCNIFSVPYKMQISGISVQAANIASTDAFEVILYTDPLGTPVATVTVTPDQDVVSATTGNSIHMFHITPTTLTPNVTYGVALRPTTTNNITFYSVNVVAQSVADMIKGALPLPNCKVGTRTNQTGAFSDQNNLIPIMVLDVCGLDDGVQAGVKKQSDMTGGVI